MEAKAGRAVEYFKGVRKKSTDQDVINWIDNNQDTISCADKLLGQMRNLGMHAGGIVVTPIPVYNLIPVTRGSGNLITAFREADGSAKDLGELGILKLDVLGLKTLNVLKECCRRIKEDTGLDLYEKIYYLPLDDKKMIDAFASGNNFGIFQMDRSAMFTSTFRDDGAPVDSFEDIVAINAMNRPGPLEKFLPKYGKWKALDKGTVEYTAREVETMNRERYPFDFMRGSLEQTHGCLDKDEKVYMPSTGTFKTIKDIVEGDVILSKNEDGYSSASNKLTIHRGVNDIYEYTLKTGTKIRVTKDHRINTLYGEMEIGKAFATGTSIILPKILQVNNKKESDLSEKREARLIGLLLSNGNFKRTNIVFTNSDALLLANFEHLIENWYGECKIEKYHKKNETYDYVISGKRKRINPLNERLRELGLKGKGSRDKFIPDSYFLMDDDFKLRLLGGLFDGDGGATNENAYYKTMSPRLAEGIALLCRQLGMLPIIKTNSDGSTRVVLDLHSYKRISKFMMLEYKKRERETYPYYNQPDKAFVQEMMRSLCGSERAYCKQHTVSRKNHGKFYKDQEELRNVFERQGNTALFDNNYFVQIASEVFVKQDEVYDLSIAGEPWFVAGEGGILVHNCLLYQEQFMQMICDVTGMTFGDADSFRRAIAWRPDNPKYHTVKGYFDKLEESMLSQGYTKEDVDKFVQYCRDFMGYSFNRSHSVVYSYISWQTLYFKVYYPAYFYAAMLNMTGNTDEVQDIIEDAKKNNIAILPLSVTKSEYHSKPETDTSIRLGYQLIKGMGESVEAELKTLELHKCRTIDEVLQKPFKKINSTALANLVRLGCFDEFGVDRALITQLKDLYKEPKIEKWFSRKRSPAEAKTMPDVLKEIFPLDVVLSFAGEARENIDPQGDNSAEAHKSLINKLTPYLEVKESGTDEQIRIKRQKETIAAETELLGFSISEDEQFASFIKSMRSADFASFSEWNEEDTPACYFKIVKITELKTKNGKPYWQYLLNDGKKDIKAKVWRQNTKVKEGDLGIGALEHSDWGWTLLKVEVI